MTLGFAPASSSSRTSAALSERAARCSAVRLDLVAPVRVGTGRKQQPHHLLVIIPGRRHQRRLAMRIRMGVGRRTGFEQQAHRFRRTAVGGPEQGPVAVMVAILGVPPPPAVPWSSGHRHCLPRIAAVRSRCATMADRGRCRRPARTGPAPDLLSARHGGECRNGKNRRRRKQHRQRRDQRTHRLPFSPHANGHERGGSLWKEFGRQVGESAGPKSRAPRLYPQGSVSP